MEVHEGHPLFSSSLSPASLSLPRFLLSDSPGSPSSLLHATSCALLFFLQVFLLEGASSLFLFPNKAWLQHHTTAISLSHWVSSHSCLPWPGGTPLSLDPKEAPKLGAERKSIPASNLASLDKSPSFKETRKSELASLLTTGRGMGERWIGARVLRQELESGGAKKAKKNKKKRKKKREK